MDAAALARRIYDNLEWAETIGSDAPVSGLGFPDFFWSRLQDLWAQPTDVFLNGIYLLLLRRPPDPQGLATHRAALRGGAPRADVVRAIALGEEARWRRLEVAWLPRLEELDHDPVGDRIKKLWLEPDAAFVEGLYALLFGRRAEPQALAHYCAALARGRSRASVVGTLALSAEARTRGLDADWLPRLRTLPGGPAPRPRLLSLSALQDVLHRLAHVRPHGLWSRLRRRWGRAG
jgi:hypothetical protein